MTAVNTNHLTIEFGTAVLTYNRWTEYENRDVHRHFRQATAEDIRNLKSGDAIWIDEDPIHPNGKVYGFVKTRVDCVEGNKIHFDGGFTTLHNKIFIVDDESVLAEMIAADPKMTDVVGESGRMATRLIQEFGPRGALKVAKQLGLSSEEN
ncbi:MAG TPA: hypothetical protein VD998_04065 [Verrucomicrobiae bacterium]|nr:hypothetical protein [Verrucomicrobiae bacterium]